MLRRGKGLEGGEWYGRKQKKTRLRSMVWEEGKKGWMEGNGMEGKRRTGWRRIVSEEGKTDWMEENSIGGRKNGLDVGKKVGERKKKELNG